MIAIAGTALMTGTVSAETARFQYNGNGTTTNLNTGFAWENKSYKDASVNDMTTRHPRRGSVLGSRRRAQRGFVLGGRDLSGVRRQRHAHGLFSISMPDAASFGVPDTAVSA